MSTTVAAQSINDKLSIDCCGWTRATRYLTRIVLYTWADAQVVGQTSIVADIDNIRPTYTMSRG